MAVRQIKGKRWKPFNLCPAPPRIAEIYFTYAMALAKVGRCGETLQIAQQVQSTIPTDDLSVGNVNQAINTCQQALKGTATSLPSGASTATPALETLTPELHLPVTSTPELSTNTPTP